MFGINKITTKAVDHLAEMKAAIDKAINAAESVGVKPAAMIEYFEGCLNYARQRALHASDQTSITRMHDSRGVLIDHHGAIARAQAIREEQRRLASEQEWRNQSTAALKSSASETSTSDDDRRSICFNRCSRHIRRCCVGGTMIAFIDKWLRRRAVPPPEPAFAFCGVSFNRATDTTTIDGELTQEVMRRIASNKFFEIEYL